MRSDVPRQPDSMDFEPLLRTHDRFGSRHRGAWGAQSKKLVEELLTREEFPLFITVSITGKNRKRNPARGRDGTSASSD